MGLYVDRETRKQLKGESHKGKSKKKPDNIRFA